MRFLIGILILFTVCKPLFSQGGEPSSLGTAFEGRHFFLGFMQNEVEVLDNQLLQILMVSSFPANIIVKVRGDADKFYSVKSDSIVKINIRSDIENREPEIISDKTIEIISDVPILVYAFNSQLTTSDCYTAVPVSQWGNEYVIMSYPNDQYVAAFNYYSPKDSSFLIPRKSEFMILASEDDSRIEITPTAITNSLRSKGNPYYVTLDKGDCYLVQSWDYQIGGGDLSGSIVRCDKPIGVISGHVRTAIPQYADLTDDSKDHLADMLSPTSAWGRQFFSVPYNIQDGGDLFRITNIDPNTVVLLETEDTTYTIFLDNPGVFATIPSLNKPAKWTSNNRIQIGQYMMRKISGAFYEYYDPCLVILPPSEQFVSNMIFQTVGNEPNSPNQYSGHAIYVVTEFEAINSLKLDGQAVTEIDPDIWVQGFPNSSKKWTRLLITNGKHHLTCESGSFSGIAYGFGSRDSYAVTLGTSLVNPYITDTISPNISIEENCGVISGTITEVMDLNSSGLLFAYMSDRSYNYSFVLDPQISDSTNSTTFTAKPVNNLANGRFILGYFDKNGNGKQYEYIYYGVGFFAPDTIDFDTIMKEDSVCVFTSVPISGNVPVRLDSVELSNDGDQRLKLYPFNDPPSVLNTGDKFDFMLCFKPENSYLHLRQKVFYYFDCGRIDSTYITGTVYFPDIEVIGYDFGDLCLGKEAFGEVMVINKGNVPLIIDTVQEIKFERQFGVYLLDDDSLPILPKTIPAHDTFRIKVSFEPEQTGSFEKIIYAQNNLGIYNEIHITGNGIQPEIRSIAVDWGKRRIGTINDTTVYLENIGDCETGIEFNGFDGNETRFMTDSIDGLKDTLGINGRLKIETAFNPQIIETSNLKAFFRVNSPGHDFAIVDLKGEGSLPIIETINIDFDTLDVFTMKDTLAEIILSKGNERLLVNYKSESGDTGSFTINGNDKSFMLNKYIDIDSSIKVPINFHPSTLGKHEMVVTITHDAFPAFQTGDTIIKISGFAVEADTLRPLISFENNLKYIPCNDNIFNINVFNDGNVPLSLDTILFNTQNLSAGWVQIPKLPVTIDPDSILSLKLEIIPKANETGVISLYTVFNDTLKYLTEEFNIEKIIHPLTIYNPGLVEYVIGDSSGLFLSGNFPHGAEIDVGFEIELKVAHKYLHLMSNSVSLNVTNSSGSYSYPLSLIQTDDRIYGSISDVINVTDSSDWSIYIPILTLLSDSRTTEIQARVSSDLCYSPYELTFDPLFVGVCAFNIRQVLEGGVDDVDVNLSPNPVTDELCIKINLSHDDCVNLSIFDQNGKKIALSENLNLKKGSHSLIFEISPMASGIYMLSVRTEMRVKNTMFIITK